ncbi:sigma-70 family RNA polymerase sigma factor [Candidatus Nitronereus thalassa]|uniref:Sigma-70 family RNA polymerase sigma factor n=1 Tax=Candidatus Nitronereus thalassa TaxID=3020898 RepID=A0ABU3K5T6_9BACT|nr:sigma-70 family RNA polymerase sigma factor [Candidatus Nitronereus thalassa]MDT7041746.1 sigma-70 family RNA polymerase sigma factor [Candidatus Nitronereus thalassa]
MTDTKQSDHALIDSITQGDIHAFESLYDRYASKVLKRCYFICLHTEQAHDLMQEVWIKVFLNLHTFKKEAAFSTWLYRLTTNHCLNYLKSKIHSEKLMQTIEQEESKSIDYSVSADVKNILSKLSIEDRTILAMKFMGEYTYEEISAACGMGVSAAKMKVSRLLTKLREEV